MYERYLDIDKDVLLGFLQEGYTTTRQVDGRTVTIRLVDHPLPEDALLVAACIWHDGRVRLRIASATFTDEQEGTVLDPPPLYHITYEED